jgi:hypothetical protein
MLLAKILKNNRVEKRLKSVSFKKYVFTPVSKHWRANLYISMFTEFGCESLAIHYLMRDIRNNFPEYRIIVLGWNDRHFLYSDLCDEFWEIDKEFMWLREYSRAFSHNSINLKWIEASVAKMGHSLNMAQLSKMCLRCRCTDCNEIIFSSKKAKSCRKCGSYRMEQSLLSDPHGYKRFYTPISKISEEKMNVAKSIIGDKKTIALFARKREAYGRNLPWSFYDKLIDFLHENDYQVVWLGERTSVAAIERKDIIDLVNLKEATGVELTLAILSLCEISIQFWTASTRLSAMVGTPFLLIESPDQIVGNGQEGIRLCLTSDPHKNKLVFCNYVSFMNNIDVAPKIMGEAALRLLSGNTDDEIGFVDDVETVKNSISSSAFWNKQ